MFHKKNLRILGALKGLIFLIFIQFNIFASFDEQIYNEGLKATDLNEKIKNFSYCLKLNPEHKDALIERAKVYLKINNLSDAENDINTYLSKFSPDINTYKLLAQIAHKNGMLDKALENYKHTLSIQSKDIEANFQTGLINISIAKLKNNPNYYKTAITYLKNVPNNSKLYLNALNQIARCLEFDFNYNETEKIYINIIKSTPNNSFNLFNLARLQYMNKKFKDSFNNLNLSISTSLRINPIITFSAVFRFYIEKNLLNNEKAASFNLKKFINSNNLIILDNLFKDKISPQNFVATQLSKDLYKNLSKKQMQAKKSEFQCLIGYYYLSKNNLIKAKETFKEASSIIIFGTYYYYLSRFEYQRLNFLT